jgi:hypothetical protein
MENITMKRQKTERIKNELPELLEAVCGHPDCPEWLYDGVWDLIGDKGGAVLYTANHFRAALEAVEVSEQWEQERQLNKVEITEVENEHAN